MERQYHQAHADHQFYVADPPPPRGERVADTCPSPALLVELAELVEKAEKVLRLAGYEPLTTWLDKIITEAPATPEEMQERFVELQQSIKAGLLRIQALGITPEKALADCLAKCHGKGLSDRQLIFYFLKEAPRLSNRDIADGFGMTVDNVRQIIWRIEHCIGEPPQEGREYE